MNDERHVGCQQAGQCTRGVVADRDSRRASSRRNSLPRREILLTESMRAITSRSRITLRADTASSRPCRCTMRGSSFHRPRRFIRSGRLVLGYTGRWIDRPRGERSAAAVLRSQSDPPGPAHASGRISSRTPALLRPLVRSRWRAPGRRALRAQRLLFRRDVASYTEGLSFALAFASFLALHRATSSTRVVTWAFVAGCAARPRIPRRSQMIAVAIGTIPVLAFAAWRARSVRAPRVLGRCRRGRSAVDLYLGCVPGLAFLGEWKSVPKVAVPLYFEPGEFGSVLAPRGCCVRTAARVQLRERHVVHAHVRSGCALPPIAAVAALLALRRKEPSQVAGDGASSRRR
jgi:hypothetical protein